MVFHQSRSVWDKKFEVHNVFSSSGLSFWPSFRLEAVYSSWSWGHSQALKQKKKRKNNSVEPIDFILLSRSSRSTLQKKILAIKKIWCNTASSSFCCIFMFSCFPWVEVVSVVCFQLNKIESVWASWWVQTERRGGERGRRTPACGLMRDTLLPVLLTLISPAGH